MDQEFLAYPLRELADAALQAARDRGAGHADFRVERIRGQLVRLSDGTPETLADSDDIGLAVRVVVDGTWGFAATVDLTPEAAAHAAAAAVTVARTAAPLSAERIELAAEPALGRGDLGLGLRDRPVRGADRGEGGAARGAGAPGCWRPPG